MFHIIYLRSSINIDSKTEEREKSRVSYSLLVGPVQPPKEPKETSISMTVTHFSVSSPKDSTSKKVRTKRRDLGILELRIYQGDET